MNKSNDIINSFSPHLFWDIDIQELDMEKHKSYIVGRVIDYGKLKDWKIINTYYSPEQLREIVLNLRSLLPQSLSFVSTIFQIPVEQFRCYKQSQLNPQHWNF